MKRDDVKALDRRIVHGGMLKVAKVVLDAPRFSGGRMQMTREIVLRPDSAAALVHDTQRDVFILAEQLRAPAYAAGQPGWLAEIVAGKLDGEESPEACIVREIEEEIGYRVKRVEPIAVYFSAPGYSTERVHLFYAAVTPDDLVRPDAAGVDEGEDIQRLELPRAEFLDRLDKRDFADGKLLAISGWALKRFG